MKKSMMIILSLLVMAGVAFAEDALGVQFGKNGKSFIMKMEANETAQKIMRDVGSQSWNLPIYDFDNYQGWEYFQYYDIARRYTYKANPVQVTKVKAGEVYYSHPNRIILFYHDATVNMQLTKIGQIDGTAEFSRAVAENPVLEYWGNKLVSISK